MKLSLRTLVLLAGLLGLADACLSYGQVPNQKAVAVVNGESILQAELDAVIKISQPQSPTPLTEAQKKEIQTGALNMLIEDMLMRQYLRQHAPAASAKEVEKELQDLIASLAKDKQSLPEFLKVTGQTEAQLRNDIAARVQWKNFITPRLTDQAVKQYFDSNKFFFDKVLVRASHVLLKVAPDASQNDRQMVYNRIIAIRQEIVTGKAQFPDAAKKYSECPSKDNGGDIGLFPFKFVVADPFAKAAFAMKVNDISDIVATEFGYHIIKVTDRTQGQPANLDTMKNEVKEIYAQEIYQYIIGEQRKVSKIQKSI